MTASNPLLFNAVVKAMPLPFLERLAVDIPRAYNEAWQMATSETLWQEPEAAYIYPHNRRGIMEAVFRKAAQEAGLPATINWTNQQSAQYTAVLASEFLLTLSYVDEPSRIPRDARFRKQNASLNAYAAQLTLDGLDGNAALKFEGAEKNCVLLHGADALDKRRVGFVEFAFPHPRYTHWFQRYSLADVLAAAQHLVSPSKTSDGVHPRLKPNTKEGGGDRG